MAEATTNKPVAVRLAQRYPNGSMVSYSARAVAHGEGFAHVIVKEEIEAGIQLAVMAPFLDGMTPARVCSVKRSRKQPGYYDVILQVGDALAAAPSPVWTDGGGDVAMGTDAERACCGSNGNGVAAKPSGTGPTLTTEAGGKLAEELYLTPGHKFTEIWRRLPEEWRSPSLLAAIAAVMQVLAEKRYADVRPLLKEAGSKGPVLDKEAASQ